MIIKTLHKISDKKLLVIVT